MAAIQNLRRKSILDRFGLKDDSLEDYLTSIGDTGPYVEPVSPVEPNLDTPNLGRVATSKTGEPKYDWKRMMDELYTPATESRDRFNRLLEAFPQREEPGFLRKLVASGASLGNVRRKIPGGLEAAENVMYAPYMRDVGAWKERAEPYAKAAQLENTANQIERQLAGNILTAQTQHERTQEQSRIADEKNAIARTRAEAYAWKQTHPDWKFDFRGPNVLAVSPDGTSMRTLGPTGHLSDQERIDLEGKWDVAASRVAGESAARRQTISEYLTVQNEDGQYVIDPTTKQVTPVGGSPPFDSSKPITIVSGPRAATIERPVTEQQRKENEFLRAREIASDPALGQYVDLDEENSTYEVYIPGIDMFAGGDAGRKVKEITDYIQGRSTVKPGAAPPTAAPPPPRTAAPPVTTPSPVAPPPPAVAPPPQAAAPPPAVPPRMQYPSSGAYGPGATPGATPGAFQVPPFMGPRQPPGPIVNPPSSSVYGPGATPRPAPGAIAPSPVPPPTATLQQRPTAKPGYVIIMKGGQIVGQIPEAERDQAIREGYAVVR